MEYKVIVAQPKAIEGRIVTGLAAVTGNIDSGGDRIFKGAFKRTINNNGSRVRHLWMHDPYQPPTAVIKELAEIGVDDLPDGIKTAHPDATGGLQVVREYLDTPRGDEILAGIKAGAISEMSIGYNPVRYDYEEIKDGDRKGMMARNLRELRLFDTSDVTWGMNELTVASKLDIAPLLPAYQERMPIEQYNLLTGLVTTVQTALQPEALKAGRVLSARNLERLKTALDVLSEILLSSDSQEDDEKNLLVLTEAILKRLSIAEHDIYLLAGG